MAVSIYDSRNPAAGVKVAPHVRGKLPQLSAGQYGGMKRVETNYVWQPTGVMRAHKEVITVGLGMISAAREASEAAGMRGINPKAEHFWLRGVRPAKTRSMSRSRSPKPPPRNLACVRPIPTQVEYERRDLQHRLHKLHRLFKQINRFNMPKVQVRMEAEYENKRRDAILIYGDRARLRIEIWERF